MDPFVEDCRKEWRRLGVPDEAAGEMAADLSADLDEARAEGVAPEEVLGNGIFDPRSFARSWATERGLVAPPGEARAHRRAPALAVAVVFAIVAAIGGGLVIGAHRGELRVRRVDAGPFIGPPFRECMATYFPRPPTDEVTPPGPEIPRQIVPPGRCRALIHARAALGGLAVQIGPSGGTSSGIGWILLAVGLLGAAISGVVWWVTPGRWSRAAAQPGTSAPSV